MKNNTKKRKTKSREFDTPKLDFRCAGIDVGADSIFVCALDSAKTPEVREYPMFTRDLISMAEWLKERGVESVAMESTSVYWIPVFEILEDRDFEVLLVNAYHLKCVPGRKTDVKDSQWIQQLHSTGYLRASFRPEDDYVRLRTIVRQRAELFKEGACQIQHMHKALTQMNIQLRMVISDITGKTGLAIIRAILDGERDPDKLALLRDKRCKKDMAEISKALEGNWRDEQIFILRQSYETYEFFHKQINECEQQIKQITDKLPSAAMDILSENKEYLFSKDPFEAFYPDNELPSIKKNPARRKKKREYDRSPYYFDVTETLTRLCGVAITEIPGIEGNIAMSIISEIGTNMDLWKNKKHFSSWLCLCPGNKISGGKILNSKTRPSNNRVAQALRLAANSVQNSDSYLGAYYRRMRAKFGPAKAITATAHKIGIILYTMIKKKKNYKELGSEYYEKKYQERVVRSLEKKAKELGYEIRPIEKVA